MLHQLAERRGRTARPARVSVDARTQFTTIIIALFAAGTLLAGCSPYPVYNSSTGARPQISETDEADDPDIGGTTEDRRRNSESDPDERMPVQPTIFSRVVEEYLGVPYVLGGHDTDGIDCSNLVRVLYRDYDGTRLPAKTSRLYNLPNSVSSDALAVGDLVFFKFNGSDVSHVGVCLGDGRFVHASESSGVIISSLKDPAYKDRYAGARRVQ
jgi:lipoprotein Spr